MKKITLSLSPIKKVGVQFISVYFLFLYVCIFPQNISIRVAGSPKKAALYELKGENAAKIDSLISNGDIFEFSLYGKHHGFYRLQFDKGHYLNFINDGKEVVIKSDYQSIKENQRIVISESNKLYQEFVGLNKSFKTKTELLNGILQRYPKDDGFYDIALQKFEELKYDYSIFVDIKAQKNPESFIARYISSARLPSLDGALPYEKQLTFLKAHALDYVDFNDDELVYSDCFTNKSIEFLMYYRNPQLPKELLEKEFMKAIDTLLTKASVNIIVYRHIAEYLIDGFQKFGFDKVVDYVLENFVIKDNLCLDEKLESSVQKRINQAQKFKTGSIVPNIVLPNEKGEPIDLSEIESEKILIIFYASWCPHCKEIIPKINELYQTKNRKKIEIVAVSLDEKKSDWTEFISKNNLTWLNVSDLKGWYGKAAEDYFIYATPTMFFVDKNRKLLSKPLTFDEVKELFN